MFSMFTNADSSSSTLRNTIRNTIQNTSQNTSPNTSPDNSVKSFNNLVDEKVLYNLLNIISYDVDNQYADIKQTNVEKARLLEINKYTNEQYNSHINLMKMIILFVVPMLIIAILGSKGIFPSSLSYTLVILILLVGIYMVGSKIYDLTRRNNMNYDEYDQNYNYKLQQSIDSGNGYNSIGDELFKDFSGLGASLNSCYGASCCSLNQTFDSNIKKCITK